MKFEEITRLIKNKKVLADIYQDYNAGYSYNLDDILKYFNAYIE